MYETVDWEQVAHEDLERTAYHEAGHALFATKHDMALDAVYVRPSGTSASIQESAWVGQTSCASRERFEPYCLATILGRAFVYAQFALAGPAAEAIVFEDAEEKEEATWAVLYDLGGTDLERLTEALATLSPDGEDPRQPLAYMLLDLVCSFLVANRKALDAIARALIESEAHSLTAPEVHALVADAERVAPADDTARSVVGL